MFKSGLTIWYNVRSLSATRNFYHDVLKFDILLDDEVNGMLIFKTPTKDTEIGFSSAQEVIPSTASVVFEVDDIKAAVVELEKRGITFLGGIDVVPDLVMLATFTDPDGHSLMLAESIK